MKHNLLIGMKDNGSKLFLLCIIFYSFVSCKNDKHFQTQLRGKDIKVSLDQYSDSLYALNLFVNDSLNSTWELKYPVYQINFGDVNNDSIPEIIVGTIKATRYDRNIDKRLFIFKITDDYYIRPMWMGSRVSQPLVDFSLKEQDPVSKIRTIEREQDGTYLVAEYRWRGFGLDFIEYIHRHISIDEAKKELNKR